MRETQRQQENQSLTLLIWLRRSNSAAVLSSNSTYVQAETLLKSSLAFYAEPAAKATRQLASHSPHMWLAFKLTLTTPRRQRLFYLLLEPLGVLGYEVSHRPEPPEPNSSDGHADTPG